MERKPFLILRSNLSLSFASIKSGLVQTETTSGRLSVGTNRGRAASEGSLPDVDQKVKLAAQAAVFLKRQRRGKRAT